MEQTRAKTTVSGLTKLYAPPEAVATFQRLEIADEATKHIAHDIYSLRVMIPWFLFVEA